jgi:DNA polymerase-3 subunit epsilon
LWHNKNLTYIRNFYLQWSYLKIIPPVFLTNYFLILFLHQHKSTNTISMWYAIVDIETTGGHAASHGITEISIHLHDGTASVGHYETLINPHQFIPHFITGLTGISNEMVRAAPQFSEVAERIYTLLQDNVFVAHNVNFDYSFIKSALAACGYELNANKLCTVRLSRKIFPGLPSYSLGNICGYLDIPIAGRHRAGGDARATVKLFEKLIAQDSTGIIKKSLRKTSKEQSLPPHVPREHYERLPDLPGIYYFHDQKGKVVYVGKAKRIKKRVSSHFSNNSTAKQKQDFLRAIHAISYEVCGNELVALLLESHEIKRLWPQFNRAQKHYEPRFGIIEYSDQRGIARLAMQKLRKSDRALACYSSLAECLVQLRNAVEEYALCPRLGGVATDPDSCADAGCPCQKGDKKQIAAYNKKAAQAIKALSSSESFVILEEGRTSAESAYVVVENGQFTGMGYMPLEKLREKKMTLDDFREVSLYKENFNIRSIVSRYKEEHPDRVISFS